MNDRNMIIFIDFDDVLFDKRAFRDEWLKVFTSLGVSPEDSWALYNRTLATRTAYDLDLHLALVREAYPLLDMESLGKQLDAIRAGSRRYVFEESIPFLESLKQSCRIELVTSGVPRHQEGKIHASGLVPHVGAVHVVPLGGKKSDFLSRLPSARRGRFVFIDDITENIEHVKAVFPEACVIQLARYEDQVRSERADAITTNLYDTIAVIQEYAQ